MHSLAEQAQAFVELQNYLVTSASAMFGGYGLLVEHSIGAESADIDGDAVMAVIGYGAPTIRGAVLILTSRAVVVALQPKELESDPPTETTLRDVLGEFCNMLVGRVNNQLVARDVELFASTPATVFGNQLVLPVPTGGMSAWHTFASAAGRIHVRLDATFSLQFKLSTSVQPEAHPVEGEMVLF